VIKMLLNDERITNFFQGCAGDSKQTFKEYLISLPKTKDDYNNGFVVDNPNNYILSDIERLLDKSLLNIWAADCLFNRGYFSWGTVTAYYSSFFSVQAINRLNLKFKIYIGKNIKTVIFLDETEKNEKNVIKITKSNQPHENEFEIFKEKCCLNLTAYTKEQRLAFDDYEESKLRNDVNYSLSSIYFDESILEKQIWLDIKEINKKNIFECDDFIYDKYSLAKEIKISMSRIYAIVETLNVLANKCNEYKNYYENNMNNRIIALNEKFIECSDWVKQIFVKILKFKEIELQENEKVIN